MRRSAYHSEQKVMDTLHTGKPEKQGLRPRKFADRHGFWGRFVKSLQNTAFRRFSVAFHGLGNGRRLC